MAAIGLVAAESADRSLLETLLGELGHRADGWMALDQALESAQERRPNAFLVVDGGGSDGEILTRELTRAFPLLPVVAALKTRDARRAVTLMRAGAAEVVAPPWTSADLKACVSKSLRWQGTTLSPIALAPRRRSAVWYALAVGAFLAVALGAASLHRQAQLAAAAAARADSWALPMSHPAGLAFDGKNLWVVDWFTQSLYELAREDAGVMAIRHLTAETPVSAAFAADGLWTVAADGTISRRMRDLKMTSLQRYPKAATSSAGLAFDGLYLWTLDQQHKILTKRLLDETLTPLASWKIPGLKPVAIAWDGHGLWTLDAGDRVLRRHDLERPNLINALTALPEYADGVYEPTGLAWDGERFWTVSERRDGKGPGRLYRHREEGNQ